MNSNISYCKTSILILCFMILHTFAHTISDEEITSKTTSSTTVESNEDHETTLSPPITVKPVSSNLSCYVCDNGHKKNVPCELGESRIKKDIAPKRDCKSLIQFHTKYNRVSNDYNERYMRKKQGRTGGGNFSEKVVETTYQFCAHISKWVIESSTPETIRDCLFGTKEAIEKDMKYFYDVEFNIDKSMNNNGILNVCAEPEETDGKTKTRICLCNTDKCNDKAGADFCRISMNGRLIIYIVSFLVFVEIKQTFNL